MKRFVVLDSWRGVAACMVALFHFDFYNPYSHLYAVPLV
jgi:peptidoglycan/LPS O-acetylase OafA/YrhL